MPNPKLQAVVTLLGGDEILVHWCEEVEKRGWRERTGRVVPLHKILKLNLLRGALENENSFY